jgi:hypothetical protein
MTELRRSCIGTEELVGATVTRVDWDEMWLEKDGRTLHVSLEYSEDYDSCWEGDCSCSYGNASSAYFRAEELVS